MKFKMYVKVKNKYELREIETKGNDGRDFFKRLLLSINEQLAIIRVSMLKFNDNEIKINLRHPHHPDTTINIKLKSLEKIRKLNLITKENLLNLLHENEFIICPQCDRKMIKTPIDTSYIKVDNTFIIKNNKTPVRYSYICENCLNAIDEEAYISLQRNKKTREELLKAGYNFVPNDFGNWHYIEIGRASCRERV